MLPGFRVYSQKYTRLALLSITLPCGLLAMSLARNVIDIQLHELIFGLGAIAVSVTFAMVRDERGYWIYAVRALKVYEPEEERQRVLARKPNTLAARLFQRPLYASLLALLFTMLISVLGHTLFRGHIELFIYASGFVLLPLFLIFLLARALVYHLHSALVTPLGSSNRRRFGISTLIASDLLLSLLVNFALVLPIARKPSFSLAQGYGSLPFIIAFMILLLVVLLFMLFFAAKPRRYVLAGELLSGDIDADFARGRPWLRLLTPHRGLRYGGYAVVVALWSILLCLLFSSLPLEAQFVPLYPVGLLPILLIYCCERYHVLFDSFLQAQDIHRRMKVSGLLKLQP